MTELTAFLRIPLYLAGQVPDVDAFEGLNAEQQRRLPQAYSREELTHIVAALRLACEHRDLDLLPFAPQPGFTNAQLHRFVAKVLASMPADLLA